MTIDNWVLGVPPLILPGLPSKHSCFYYGRLLRLDIRDYLGGLLGESEKKAIAQIVDMMEQKTLPSIFSIGVIEASFTPNCIFCNKTLHKIFIFLIFNK